MSARTDQTTTSLYKKGKKHGEPLSNVQLASTLQPALINFDLSNV